MTKKNALLINLSLLLTVFTTLALTIEIGARILYDDSEYYGKFPLLFQHAPPEDIYINSNNGLTYFADSQKLFASSYKQFDYDKISQKKEQDQYRIVVIGDSYTFGKGVYSDKDKYTSQLEDIINKSYSIEGINKIEVLPFAQGGFNTHQEAIILKEVAMLYSPDLVILQYEDRDALPPRQPLGWGAETRSFISTKTNVLVVGKHIVPALPYVSENISREIFKRSKFMRYASHRVNNFILSFNISKEDNDSNFNDIRDIEKITRDNNIPLVIINFPPAVYNNDFCGWSPNGKYSGIFLHNKLRNLSNELDITFLNMCDLVDNLLLIKSNVPGDSCHYNSNGYRIAAEALAEAVVKEATDSGYTVMSTSDQDLIAQ